MDFYKNQAVAVAVQRWQELTGKVATLEASGEAFEVGALPG